MHGPKHGNALASAGRHTLQLRRILPVVPCRSARPSAVHASCISHTGICSVGLLLLCGYQALCQGIRSLQSRRASNPASAANMAQAATMERNAPSADCLRGFLQVRSSQI